MTPIKENNFVLYTQNILLMTVKNQNTVSQIESAFNNSLCIILVSSCFFGYFVDLILWEDF